MSYIVPTFRSSRRLSQNCLFALVFRVGVSTPLSSPSLWRPRPSHQPAWRPRRALLRPWRGFAEIPAHTQRRLKPLPKARSSTAATPSLTCTSTTARTSRPWAGVSQRTPRSRTCSGARAASPWSISTSTTSGSSTREPPSASAGGTLARASPSSSPRSSLPSRCPLPQGRCTDRPRRRAFRAPSWALFSLEPSRRIRLWSSARRCSNSVLVCRRAKVQRFAVSAIHGVFSHHISRNGPSPSLRLDFGHACVSLRTGGALGTRKRLARPALPDQPLY